jgi:hypothetical protein
MDSASANGQVILLIDLDVGQSFAALSIIVRALDESAVSETKR